MALYRTLPSCPCGAAAEPAAERRGEITLYNVRCSARCGLRVSALTSWAAYRRWEKLCRLLGLKIARGVAMAEDAIPADAHRPAKRRAKKALGRQKLTPARAGDEKPPTKRDEAKMTPKLWKLLKQYRGE